MSATRVHDHQLRELLEDRRSFTEELDEIASAYDADEALWDEPSASDSERDAFSGEPF